MNVALFVTCLADHYFAEAAAHSVRLLRHLGCEVTFPDAQTCCGQPAYNAGRHVEALRMARHTIDVFEAADAVVVPSGSCATMVKKFYPRLAGGTDQRPRATGRRAEGAVAEAAATAAEADAKTAAELADRTFELAEFIVHRLGVTKLGTASRGAASRSTRGATRSANCASRPNQRRSCAAPAPKSSHGRRATNAAASAGSSR